MFERILIGTDLTSQSSGALQLALKMAAPAARILAVHVIDMPPVLARWENPKLGADVANYRDLLKRQIAAAERTLRDQLAALGAQRIEAAIRVGHPPTHIATAADQHRAEVILVGRGAGGRLGPIAEAVVRLSGRTVVVAPVPRAPRKQRPLPSSHRRRGRIVA
jgi:nucleotide-binding universal stress UspA family protein